MITQIDRLDTDGTTILEQIAAIPLSFDLVAYLALIGGFAFPTHFEGNDTLNGGSNDDYLLGYGGDDGLVGDAGNDSLLGGVGNDVLTGGAGNDVLNGEGDNDTADYTAATSGVVVSLALAGLQAVGGGQGSDQLAAIENLVGSAGNDTLTGNGNNNRIAGKAGNDTVVAAGGSDILVGGSGNVP